MSRTDVQGLGALPNPIGAFGSDYKSAEDMLKR